MVMIHCDLKPNNTKSIATPVIHGHLICLCLADGGFQDIFIS